MKDSMISVENMKTPITDINLSEAVDRISAIERRIDTMEQIMENQNANMVRVIAVLENMKLRS